MNKIQLIAGLMLFAFTSLITSCKKDEQVGMDASSMTNEGVSSFVDKSIEEDEDAVIFKSMMGGNGQNCGGQGLLAECAIVTESSETFPKTITIDFGDGCTNSNGVTKSGQIIVSLSDDMMNEGAVRTVTFQDFYINNVHVQGTRVTTNTGVDGENHPTFSRTADMTITHNGNIFQRSFNGNVTWLSGYDTPECGDNVFELTGSGTAIRPNGVEISRVIVTPMILDRICGYVTAGVVEVSTPQGIHSINFGDGTCDDIAIVTAPDGTVHTIELHP